MARSHFVVIHKPGPNWDHDRDMREQERWDAHAEFMDELTDEGFIVLGGPIGGDGHRAMLVVDAADDAEVRARLDRDPWKPDMLVIDSVWPWTVLLDSVRA
jgi:uncharacterized protein YciI